MKGSTKVIVENINEFHGFPVTTTWSWSQDNTIEALEEWVDVFNMILNNQGFHYSTRVGVLEGEEKYGGEDDQ